MTDYTSTVDKTEGGNGQHIYLVVGSGGVTAGNCVQISSGLAVECSANSQFCIGIARDTVAEGGTCFILGPGCLVQTATTLTADAFVEPTTGGAMTDYTSGIPFAQVIKSATDASIIRIIEAHP